MLSRPPAVGSARGSMGEGTSAETFWSMSASRASSDSMVWGVEEAAGVMRRAPGAAGASLAGRGPRQIQRQRLPSKVAASDSCAEAQWTTVGVAVGELLPGIRGGRIAKVGERIAQALQFRRADRAGLEMRLHDVGVVLENRCGIRLPAGVTSRRGSGRRVARELGGGS